MIRLCDNKKGFALPTILIASVIMLTVLISAVGASSSIRSAMNEQYYTQLAREAAESGLARANGCLRDSAYIAGWDDTNQLRPNTDCDGGSPCANDESCFVMVNSTMRTTFSVKKPDNLNVAQIVRAEGKVELLRKTSGEVWRTYTYSASARIGVDLNLNTLAFGYMGNGGAYFATIAADGRIRSVGYNVWGQLGTGTTASTLYPAPYLLDQSERGVAIFTNFMSGGYSMYVLAESGSVYGTGWNANGQLGDGTTISRSLPVKYGLPAGQEGRSVIVNGYSTYVLAKSGNVYATGLCMDGLLGTNYTISGCSNIMIPTRVALPAVTSDENTIPTTNIVTDYRTVLLRMQGGRVYGWGNGARGQFANGTTNRSVPVQVGTYGNSGQPKAVQVASDGVSSFILDDTGKLNSSGYNGFGQLGGENITISNVLSGHCIDNTLSDGVSLQLHFCNDTTAQRFTFRSDGSIYHPTSGKCIDNTHGDAVHLRLYACNGTSSQRFTLRDDNTIYIASVGKCMYNSGKDGITFILGACGTSAMYQFDLEDINSRLVKFGIPASAGTITKVATDQWFTSVLTSTGEVYSAGANNKGQLGNGTMRLYQPYPVKFILPSGVTAVDVYSTAYGTISNAKSNNTFVIGSDGKVYGVGSNYYGQLGDGTTTDRSTPVPMLNIDGTTVKAKQVVSGDGTTVVLTHDGKAYTVGNNANGQLGDGTTTNSSVPKVNRYTNVLPVTSF